MYQRPRITRVTVEYAGGEESLSCSPSLVKSSSCIQRLSELAHEHTAMGVLGPIQLIGRRRGEYPLVHDTVSWRPRIKIAKALGYFASVFMGDSKLLEYNFYSSLKYWENMF